MKIKLREILMQPIAVKGQKGVVLTDPLGISQQSLFIPGSLVLLLSLMDGTRESSALKTAFELRTGMTLNDSNLQLLVSELDGALFLENERFKHAYKVVLDNYRSATSRPFVLKEKCYPTNPEELNVYLQRYFDQLTGDDLKDGSELKAMICPHIDFERGGHIYAEVWSKAKAAIQETELFIILGTDHHEAKGRVTLTRQDYQTPWGIIPTAQDVVGELVNEIGDDAAFTCELNHRGEHSVEFALIWLHYLLGERKCQIVPVLCGSFQPFIERGESPAKAPHIAATVEVMRQICERRRTIIVAAADLAHMGPVFGDLAPLDLIGRKRMTKQDEALVNIIGRGNAEDFYVEILKEKDRRHVCGLPPIYITLSVLSGIEGRQAGYALCPASTDGTSQVSICGMLF